MLLPCGNIAGPLALPSQRFNVEALLILIVEDEMLSALSMSWELEDAGHRVLGPAASYEEALRLARRERPLLFVSAQSAVASRYHDLALGHIGKPYDLADLPRSVDAVLSRLRGTEPPAALPRSLRLFE